MPQSQTLDSVCQDQKYMTDKNSLSRGESAGRESLVGQASRTPTYGGLMFFGCLKTGDSRPWRGSMRAVRAGSVTSHGNSSAPPSIAAPAAAASPFRRLRLLVLAMEDCSTLGSFSFMKFSFLWSLSGRRAWRLDLLGEYYWSAGGMSILGGQITKC